MRCLNVVQVGLFRDAELAYLADSRWRAQLSHVAEEDRIITPSADVQYTFFGFDADPFSITRLVSQYRHNPRVWFGCLCLGTEGSQQERLLRPMCSWFGSKPQSVVTVVTLAQLLETYAPCDVLRVDIEGGELAVFEEYDFSMCPRYLQIEIHPCFLSEPRAVDRVVDVVVRNGYRLVRLTETNEGRTRDAVFLREGSDAEAIL